MTKRTFAWALIALGAVACSEPGLPESEAVASINEADYMRRIGVIAHDSMQGRDTPSEGLNRTAEWIASEFEAFGLTAAGDDGGFIQYYSVQEQASGPASLSTDSGLALEAGTGLSYPMGGLSDGEFMGELVFVSSTDGLAESAESMELEGKHVVVVPPDLEAGYSNRAARAAVRPIVQQSPASVLVVTTRAEEAWVEGIAAQEAQTRLVPEWSQGGASTPILEIRAEQAAELLGMEAAAMTMASGPAQATAMAGIQATLTVSTRVVQDHAVPNVAAVLEGSDPELRDEYVVFSAHMDHVGVGNPNAEGDSIFNGADDDASGTTAVIEVAEAFSLLAQRPRRSMIFLLVSGEEKGLWGSRYYADNPTVPGEAIVANINADMVGRNWSDTIVVIGKEHSDLGETLNRINGAHPELNMNAIDDRWPEQSFYTRSDHFNFARKGIPVLFFFNGTHEDYHRPSDEVEKIDGDKAARIAKLMFYLGMEVGSADGRPAWTPESYEQYVTDPGWN